MIILRETVKIMSMCMCMRYGRNMHNTKKLPLVINVNAIRMVRMDYMKIELDLYKHMNLSVYV